MATAKELKALITLAGRIDPSLQRALLEASNKTKTAGKSMGQLGSMGGKNMALLTKVAGKAKAGLVALGGAAAYAAGRVANIGIQLASDLKEVQNVVDVTFGSEAETINRWSEDLLRTHGISKLAAKQYSSTFGAILKPIGITDDQLRTMSQNLTMLAGDLASFHNLNAEEAFDKLRSGITGETEPLKSLGINMTVANLQAYAMSLGIKKSYSEMNQAEQAALRYNYIMANTTDAQGDFSSTSGELANQQRLLREKFKQTSAEVMQRALPALTRLIFKANELLDKVDSNRIGNFIEDIAGLGETLAPLADTTLPLIAEGINTMLPPLIDIAKIVLPPVVKVLELWQKFQLAKFEKFKEGWIQLKELGAGASSMFQPGSYEQWYADTFRGGVPQQGKYETMGGYAHGGFSNRPAIFGEAGLEAAIPIKPGNSRSLVLLERTARLLGRSVHPKANREQWMHGISSERMRQVAVLRGGGEIRIDYHPTIRGGKASEIQDVLRRHSQELAEMLDARDNRRRRLSFDPC